MRVEKTRLNLPVDNSDGLAHCDLDSGRSRNQRWQCGGSVETVKPSRRVLDDVIWAPRQDNLKEKKTHGKKEIRNRRIFFRPTYRINFLKLFVIFLSICILLLLPHHDAHCAVFAFSAVSGVDVCGIVHDGIKSTTENGNDSAKAGMIQH